MVRRPKTTDVTGVSRDQSVLHGTSDLQTPSKGPWGSRGFGCGARLTPAFHSVEGKSVRVIRIAIAFLGGVLLFLAIFQRELAMAMVGKAAGGDQPCPWSRLLRYPWETERFHQLQNGARRELSVEKDDPRFGIELIRTRGRAFWIKKQGTDLDGRALLAYILAEQSWIAENAPSQCVKPGNVVVDVGAHVGTFDDDALRRGASKCILVEPDPVNVECIRR